MQLLGACSVGGEGTGRVHGGGGAARAPAHDAMSVMQPLSEGENIIKRDLSMRAEAQERNA